MIKSNKSPNTKFYGTKRMVRKALLAVFIAVTFMLMFMAEPGGTIVERASGVAMNVVSPVAAAVKWPFVQVANFFTDIAHFKRIDREK